MSEEKFFAVLENQRQIQPLRFQLHDLGLLNKKFMIVNINREIHIPLKAIPSPGGKVVHVGDDIWELDKVRFRLVKNVFEDFSTFFRQNRRLQENIAELVKASNLKLEDFHCEIPTQWEKFGSVIIFNKNKHFRNALWHNLGPELWRTVCRTMGVETVALRGNINNDEFRSPDITVVWGIYTWADTIDNGIRFSWDIEKTMFCCGNVTERHRMGRIDCSDEVIVDMFCGIGYFTLPLIVHGKACLVHACEWNPSAITALRRNLRQNHVEQRCVIHEGDCTKVELRNIADRVILGLIPSSESAWEKACEVLKEDGGILHIHGNVNYKDWNNSKCNVCNRLVQCSCIVFENLDRALSVKDDNVFLQDRRIVYKNTQEKFWCLHILHRIREILQRVKCDYAWNTILLNVIKVKSYAPHTYHIVLDIKCQVV